MIGRLDPQKGFDLVAGAAAALAAGGARIVALGSGDAGLVAGMRAAAAGTRGGSRWSSASTATWPAGSTPARTSS